MSYGNNYNRIARISERHASQGVESKRGSYAAPQRGSKQSIIFNAEALSREVFLRFWSSLQLTFGEFADNHSASRGCD